MIRHSRFGVNRRLVNRRKVLKLTQAQLSARTNGDVTPQRISEYELGIRKPARTTRRKLAVALGTEPEALWPTEDEEESAA